MSEYLPALGVVVGVFLGAWVTWRARINQSPVPQVPAAFTRKAPVDPEPPVMKMPQAKSGGMAK